MKLTLLLSQLDGFSCPILLKEMEALREEQAVDNSLISALETHKTNLEDIVTQLKVQHKEYLNSLEVETEKSLQYQREGLVQEHRKELKACEFSLCCVLYFSFSQLDGFAAPRLLKETETLKEEVNNDKSEIKGLEEQKASLEGIIATLKEQHKDYVNSLEVENEKSLKYQRETLIKEHEETLGVCESLLHFLPI